jgi:hypothetical protein
LKGYENAIRKAAKLNGSLRLSIRQKRKLLGEKLPYIYVEVKPNFRNKVIPQFSFMPVLGQAV